MSPSPTPSPKPLSFLAPPPIRSKSASRIAYQIPKRNTITQTPTLKASKKKQFQHHRSQKSKANPSKRQSKTVHQTPPTRKYPTQTAVQIHPESAQTPLKTHTPQNARTFPLKRKCISLQTPKSLLPNAKAFHLKRKPVFRPKIPKNEKPLPPDSPKPLHFAPQPPPPEAF